MFPYPFPGIQVECSSVQFWSIPSHFLFYQQFGLCSPQSCTLLEFPVYFLILVLQTPHPRAILYAMPQVLLLSLFFSLSTLLTW